jgi:hypothetical protein
MQIISREDVKTLLEQPKSNCVSIYMPVHPAGAEVRQDPIRFKNLIKEAEARLIDAGLDQKEAMDLLSKAHELDVQEFWEQLGEHGLAIFISQDILRYYALPIDFEELVVVTDRFHVKPLLPILNGNGRFYILALSQNQVRLLVGTHYRCQEIDLTRVEGLPTSLDEALQYDDTSEKQLQRRSSAGGASNSGSPGSQAGSFHGQGSDTGGEEHKVDILRFFQEVAPALEKNILHEQQAPLVLAGVEYLLPLYNSANRYQNLMAEAITGNPEILSAQELHSAAWGIVEAYFHKSQEEVLERYHELFGGNTGKASNKLEEIIPAAYYQRIDSLVVAVNQQQWGLFDTATETVYLHDEEETGDEDLLDFAAAHTLLNGGTVYAVPPEQIPYSTPVAAIFRY